MRKNVNIAHFFGLTRRRGLGIQAFEKKLSVEMKLCLQKICTKNNCEYTNILKLVDRKVVLYHFSANVEYIFNN